MTNGSKGLVYIDIYSVCDVYCYGMVSIFLRLNGTNDWKLGLRMMLVGPVYIYLPNFALINSSGICVRRHAYESISKHVCV